MKTAIVGIGHWGKNLLKEFEKQTEVVWVCHKGSADSFEFLAENYPKIKATTILENVLKDVEVEAVIVATPTTTHFEIAQKVLMANKHLFLEKPGCSNLSELEQLNKKAEEKNLKFAVGYEFAHHPVLKRIKELIKIEDIKTMHFEWHKWGTFNAPIVPHLLSHEISIINTFGIKQLNPKKCRAQKLISESDIIETEFENDRNIQIKSHINRASVNKNKTVTITGEKESYIWNNDDLFAVEIEKQKFTPISLSKANPIASEIEDFLESIKTGRKPLTDSEFALDVWDTLNKIKG